MPSKSGVPQKKRPKTLMYSEADMLAACRTYHKNGHRLREAARLHGVPPSTLKNRLQGMQSIKEVQKTVLTASEEQKLVTWIIECARRGFGRKMSQVQDEVKKILDARAAKTPFNNNRPGDTWSEMFLARHPDLRLQSPQAVRKQQAILSEDIISPEFKIASKSSVNPFSLSAQTTLTSVLTSFSPTSASVSPPSTLTAQIVSTSVSTPPAATFSGPATLTTDLEALDRLLDVVASAGVQGLIDYRTSYSLEAEPTNLKESLFRQYYIRLRTCLSGKGSKKTGRSFNNLPPPSLWKEKEKRKAKREEKNEKRKGEKKKTRKRGKKQEREIKKKEKKTVQKEKKGKVGEKRRKRQEASHGDADNVYLRDLPPVPVTPDSFWKMPQLEGMFRKSGNVMLTPDSVSL